MSSSVRGKLEFNVPSRLNDRLCMKALGTERGGLIVTPAIGERPRQWPCSDPGVKTGVPGTACILVMKPPSASSIFLVLCMVATKEANLEEAFVHSLPRPLNSLRLDSTPPS